MLEYVEADFSCGFILQHFPQTCEPCNAVWDATES